MSTLTVVLLVHVLSQLGISKVVQNASIIHHIAPLPSTNIRILWEGATPLKLLSTGETEPLLRLHPSRGLRALDRSTHISK